MQSKTSTIYLILDDPYDMCGTLLSMPRATYAKSSMLPCQGLSARLRHLLYG
jgi:hypothetical protein